MALWFQIYLLFSAVSASLLTPWYIIRQKTVNVKGAEIRVDSVGRPFQMILNIVVWIALFCVAPFAIAEWAVVTIKERKHGKLGK